MSYTVKKKSSNWTFKQNVNWKLTGSHSTSHPDRCFRQIKTFSKSEFAVRSWMDFHADKLCKEENCVRVSTDLLSFALCQFLFLSFQKVQRRTWNNKVGRISPSAAQHYLASKQSNESSCVFRLVSAIVCLYMNTKNRLFLSTFNILS
jgi:Golgi nucleoside diphosphatase